jgi:prepilin peptidase CpaA
MTVWFSTIAVILFPLILLRAGIGDLVTMRIPNKIVLTLILSYVVLAPLSGVALLDMGLSLAAAAAVFFLALGAYSYGWMGGGDVKLLAAVTLWLGLPYLPVFLMWTSLFGGLLTLSMLLYRALPRNVLRGQPAWASRLHLSTTRVPYGVAIAFAALLVFTSTPWMSVLQ